MKEEALKLANELEDEAKYGECDWTSPRVSATMIRRLVDRIAEMEKYVGFKDSGYDIIQLPQQTKPTITKLDGKVIAVTMTDDEHRIAEVLWEAPKPLSIEEIEGAFYKKCWYYDEDEKFDYYGFAREIEERHGIK